MAPDEPPAAVTRLLMAVYGLTAEQAGALPAGAAERVAAGQIADRGGIADMPEFLPQNPVRVKG